MIAALIAAGLFTLVQNAQSNTPVEELVGELDATGVIRCPMTAEGEALDAASRARLIHISDPFGGYTPDRRIFGCSVIRLTVNPSGRVKEIKVVRHRGESTLEDKRSHFVFKPSDHEWTALLSIAGAAEPEVRADVVKDMRERAARAAQKAAAQTSPN
jgi:hypothetical protein